MRCTLLYSYGNHVWNLSASEFEKLLSMIRVLSGMVSGRFTASSTGYSGIHVRLGENETMIVYHGLIEVVERDVSRKLLDATREVEEWLLNTAFGKIDGKIINNVTMSEFYF